MYTLKFSSKISIFLKVLCVYVQLFLFNADDNNLFFAIEVK